MRAADPGWMDSYGVDLSDDAVGMAVQIAPTRGELDLGIHL
jgi:hypothetical protein